MKTIHLIRHAKSSWKDASLSDHERPLNKRGMRACKIMGKAMLAAGCDFDHVFCSTAKRAQLTIENLNAHLPEKNIAWQSDSKLYTFSADTLMNWCLSCDDVLPSVVIVGHNPALTDFCNLLSNAEIENIPTCGYVQLHCNINKWSDLSPRSAKLVQFIAPKMLE